MKKYLSVLKKCILFSEIKEENLLFMMNCLGAKVRRFEKKEAVFSAGEPAEQIGIVLSGSVQIDQTDYYGNRSVLSNVYAGEVFAEAFACASVEYLPISVVANEASEIMIIKCSNVLHMCNKSCAFHQTGSAAAGCSAFASPPSPAYGLVGHRAAGLVRCQIHRACRWI